MLTVDISHPDVWCLRGLVFERTDEAVGDQCGFFEKIHGHLARPFPAEGEGTVAHSDTERSVGSAVVAAAIAVDRRRGEGRLNSSYQAVRVFVELVAFAVEWSRLLTESAVRVHGLRKGKVSCL